MHDTSSPSFPLVQSLSGAHKLGVHHVAVSRNGKVAASAGFGGEVKIWKVAESGTGDWIAAGEVDSGNSPASGADSGSANGDGNNNNVKTKSGAGEGWAVALSENGQFLATTTYDGRIHVWDTTTTSTATAGSNPSKIRTYETGSSSSSGSFGLCVDLSRDGRYTASGHQNGSVYVFNNDTGRLQYSLPGLVKPVRAVSFSPLSTRLAAAGDAGMIAVYDTKHGEHIGNLTSGQAGATGGSGGTGSAWITSLDWSDTGEYLLSGQFDGKAKVWSVERGVCVATHSETDKALWSVKWLPRTAGSRNEMFCTAGAERSLTFYREATGA